MEGTDKEIDSRRQQLETALISWRKLQATLMPRISGYVAHQLARDCNPEEQVLYLPSEFSVAQRLELGLVLLGGQEIKMREGEAYDTVRALQSVSKSISAMRARKAKNERGQDRNTRANKQIHSVEKQRERHLATYNAARHALIALGSFEASNTALPPLTIRDTWRKSTERKRLIGDSAMPDGKIFGIRPKGGEVYEGEDGVTAEMLAQVDQNEDAETSCKSLLSCFVGHF